MTQNTPTNSWSHIISLFNPEDWIMEIVPTAADLATKMLSIKTSIEQMDIDALEQLLKAEQNFSEKDVAIFKFNLITAFEKMKAAGDTALSAIDGYCGSCYRNKGGLMFVGNVSKMHFNFLIYAHEDYLQYTEECSNFKTKQVVTDLGEQIDLPVKRWSHDLIDGKFQLIFSYQVHLAKMNLPFQSVVL